MQTTLLKSKLFVYVVIATDGDKVKECRVIQDHAEAHVIWAELIEIYGGGNVCFTSRSVNVSLDPSQN